MEFYTLHATALGQCLVLLTVANGAPILARNLLQGRWQSPLDGGAIWSDGRPVLGPAKTVRGVLAAVVATGCAAPLVGYAVFFGALFGLSAMAGDLLSSWCKRRLGLPSSASALGLDQSLEALLPAVLWRGTFGFHSLDILTVVLAFGVWDIALSRLLYYLHIRNRPL